LSMIGNRIHRHGTGAFIRALPTMIRIHDLSLSSNNTFSESIIHTIAVGIES
jgi:hypothetical protein